MTMTADKRFYISDEEWIAGSAGVLSQIEPDLSNGAIVTRDNIPTRPTLGKAYDLRDIGDSSNRDFSALSATGFIYGTSTDNKAFTIYIIPQTKELWLKFDLYRSGTRSSTDGRVYDDAARDYQNMIFFVSNQTYGDEFGKARIVFWDDKPGYEGKRFCDNFYVNGEVVKSAGAIDYQKGLNTFIFHVKSGTSNTGSDAGVLEYSVRYPDGWEDYNAYRGNIHDGGTFNRVTVKIRGLSDFELWSQNGVVTYAGDGFSNILISNTRLEFEDNVICTPYPIDLVREVKKEIDTTLTIDVARQIINCDLILDIERNILSELIFSPLETEEIFHGSSAALKLKSGLRASGTITARSFDSNEIEQNTMSERNTSGTQSVEINIAEQQLTDQVTFTSIIQYAIMQYIGGQYFDYLYKLRIESRQQQGILFAYRCCSNIDELLYTQIAYKVTSTETIQDDTQEQSSEDAEDKTIEEEEAALLKTGEYHTLTENAVAVANYFGLTPVVQLGEFAEFYSSYKEQDLWGRTYADAIREVFGWSSRIPHKLINVYIRDDKIFFVQRGSESNVIDITQTKHAMPIINQELVRTFWGSTPWSETEITEKILGTRGLGGSDDSDNDDFPADYINNDDDDEEDNPWSAVGTVTTTSNAGTSLTKYDYTSNGVLRGTTTTFTSNADSSQNSTTVVRNSYNADGLLEAVQTTVTHPAAPEEDKQTVVKYGYLSLSGGQKFLASELTAEYERNEQGFFELVDTRATAKSPTGRGQGTSYDSKGKGTASGNVGDDRVTPYQLRSAFKTTEALSVQTLKKTTTTTINGFTDIDPSFPLLLLRDRATITEYLKWLNRKTKETVSVSIYDFGHIIDFNDRIILDNKEYFVVSNNIKTMPRLYNEQNLTLARWF